MRNVTGTFNYKLQYPSEPKGERLSLFGQIAPHVPLCRGSSLSIAPVSRSEVSPGPRRPAHTEDALPAPGLSTHLVSLVSTPPPPTHPPTHNGNEREAKARGDPSEDAPGNDEPSRESEMLRLRPARPDLRQHDGRLLRLHHLLRDPVSVSGRGL